MGNQLSECRRDLSEIFRSLLSSVNGGSSCSCDREEETESPCSFKPWPYLPRDLIIEILCRLPEKPLIRFKCVSKDWNFFISNLNFTSIALCMIFQLYFTFDHTLYDLEDICNGLSLLLLRSSLPFEEYYVCNPVTKQRVAIPKNPTHLKLDPWSISLAFNPSESFNYNIVGVAQSALYASISEPPKLDVFLSDTGEWVTHAVPLDPAVYGFKWIKRGVYFNGVLHVLSSAGTLYSSTSKWGIIGCFYYSNHDGTELCIWSLGGGGGGGGGGEWILRHKISLDNILYEERRLVPHAKLSGFHPTCEMVFFMEPKMIFSYHLQTKRMELLLDMRNAEDVFLTLGVIFTYSHCLVGLNKFSNRRYRTSPLKHVLENSFFRFQ
ncbi:uncharacterized protein LOC132309685 [Cornus florida]|uniref:uncharacterized protein LOC132309685 n=1 Tax=Cornus florida TaxID=4283 RepID=UPI00289D6E28|nr:uncharacterized protein LOC132309685 [Cornus florida]